MGSLPVLRFNQFSTMVNALCGAGRGVSMPSPVMMFHGYFDESGKWRDKDDISFCGWVSRADVWEEFSKPWTDLLSEIGIDYLHSSEFIGLSGVYAPLRSRIKLEETSDILIRFAKIISGSVAIGYASALDAKHFRTMSSAFKKRMGDPHYLVFKMVMNQVMQDISLINDLNNSIDIRAGIICDQDPGTSNHCLTWFNKFRQFNDKARRCLSGICFADATGAIPLQAADLLAFAIRKEVERRRKDDGSCPSELYNTLSTRRQSNGQYGTFLRGSIVDKFYLDEIEAGRVIDHLTSLGIEL